jgi:hypothetical protein
MIGLKVSEKFKKIIQDAALDENRTISNFIKHCIITYLEEKKNIQYKEKEV